MGGNDLILVVIVILSNKIIVILSNKDIPSLLLMLSNSWIFVSPFMLPILSSMEFSFFFAIVKVSIAKLDDISSSNETIGRWNCCYVPLA